MGSVLAGILPHEIPSILLIYDIFRDHCQVNVVCKNFSNTYEGVDHSQLLKNLDLLGVGNL